MTRKAGALLVLASAILIASFSVRALTHQAPPAWEHARPSAEIDREYAASNPAPVSTPPSDRVEFKMIPAAGGSLATVGRSYAIPDLLQNQVAQTWLRLTEEQKQGVQRLRDDERQRLASVNRSELSPEEAQRRGAETYAFVRERPGRFLGLLSEDQQQEARRLLHQVNREFEFSQLEVAEELGITAEQKTRIDEIVAALKPPLTPEEQQLLDSEQKERLRVAKARRQGKPVEVVERSPEQVQRSLELNTRLSAHRKAIIPIVCEQVSALLTLEQQERWRQMQGASIAESELDAIRIEFSEVVRRRASPAGPSSDLKETPEDQAATKDSTG